MTASSTPAIDVGTQVTIGQLINLAAQITAGLADGCQEPEQWTLTTLIARAAGLHGDPARFAIFRLISAQAGPAVFLDNTENEEASHG